MTRLRVGIDENGLGAKLGPLIVTAVMARVSPEGERFLARRPRGKLALDLNDSKALVAHGKIQLAEAWARVLADDRAPTPAALFTALTRTSTTELQSLCPPTAIAQCWGSASEAFEAPAEMLQRLQRHRGTLAAKGVVIETVLTEVVCVDRLNRERSAGLNRFLSDLHAMERLVLDLRQRTNEELTAVCGKVGGMNDYVRYFGPLAGRLHVVLEHSPRCSAYQFLGLGQVRFVQDADGSDALVMLASLVGKYVRELLMGRIDRFYANAATQKTGQSATNAHARRGARASNHALQSGTESSDQPARPVSGYNDPLTRVFIEKTRLLRKQRGVPDSCFERTPASEAR